MISGNFRSIGLNSETDERGYVGRWVDGWTPVSVIKVSVARGVVNLDGEVTGRV